MDVRYIRSLGTCSPPPLGMIGHAQSYWSSTRAMGHLQSNISSPDLQVMYERPVWGTMLS